MFYADNFKLSQDPESTKKPEQMDRQTDRGRKQNAVHFVNIANYSRIKFHAPRFNSFIVIK